MQRHYELIPDKVDLGLLNGKVLSRAMRSTAVSFHAADAVATSRIHCKVAISNPAEMLVLPRSLSTGEVEDSVATRGVRMLTRCDEELDRLLREGGLLHQPPGADSRSPYLFSLAAFSKYFSRLVYVSAIPQQRQLFEWPRLLCTCQSHLLHAGCEHVLYANSLELGGRQPTRCFDDIPLRRRAGRKKATGLRGTIPGSLGLR